MKKVIKTGSSLLMKVGSGSALFGATISSAVAQADTNVGEPAAGGLVSIFSNMVTEFIAFFGIFSSGAGVAGALAIVAGLINLGLRKYKGAQSAQDTLWWPWAIFIGILLMSQESFRASVGNTVLDKKAETTLEFNP